MKIFVIDLVGRRLTRAISCALLTVTLLLSGFLGVISLATGENNIISASASARERIIIIDAGHGGEDPGAVGVNGSLEKDLTLAIALEMGRQLEEAGFAVVYTRTDDRLLYNEDEDIKGIRKISDLKNRCRIASRYPDAIFVSIHMNSYGSSKYSGLQVYYSDENDSSKLLADSVQSKVTEQLQTDNKRKIKEGDGLYVLDNVPNTSILIECGFLTNKEECEKLSQKEYQKRLSFSIICGIIEYIESEKS